MNKYVIGFAVLAIVLIAVGYLYNVTSLTINNVEAAIVVEEDSYDFGDIDIFGGKVETSYTLINTGTEDIKILSAVTSCMCTEGKIGGLTFSMHESVGGSEIIPAGGEKILTAIFDPLAHGPEGTGPITRQLFLKTNSSKTPELEVNFTGNVINNESE
jgi:hypothetical protein